MGSSTSHNSFIRKVSQYTRTIVDKLLFNRIRKSNVLDLDPENGSCGQEEQLFYNENNEQL